MAPFLSATGSPPDRDHAPGERCLPHDEFVAPDGSAVEALEGRTDTSGNFVLRRRNLRTFLHVAIEGRLETKIASFRLTYAYQYSRSCSPPHHICPRCRQAVLVGSLTSVHAERSRTKVRTTLIYFKPGPRKF